MAHTGTVIDLFCGAGGLSEGFRQAGFHVLAGSDIDETAGKTFAATHPEAKFIGGPIQNVDVKELLRTTGLRKGELDVLVGGPPCQGYSVYNHQRGVHDPRAGLFKEYLRIVAGLMPRWLVMENVSGLTSIANGAIIQEIKEGMDALGYSVDWKILKSEQYGVPQERRRIVFIANRIGAPIVFPEPTHGPGLQPYVTIWDAISDLPKLENGDGRGIDLYGTPPANGFQRELRRGANRLANHSASKLSATNLERMKHIPAGGSWRDIPFDLLPEGMKRAKRSDHTKRYGRPRKTDLSCTILTKCDVHWGAYIHPEQDRAISVREAARLQSFPDVFEFHGSRTEQYVQVGNAVPPLMGRAVALALLEANGASGVRDKALAVA
ncbi:DNA cytosine methyltransferase [Pelagibacterium sp.]|uniref:DNA cytosine methyltransferase n=1 Tax=Pelagibacterium sp. TaxID=1967288 RepID=UPI003A922D59